jgi:hypothetical protein
MPPQPRRPSAGTTLADGRICLIPSSLPGLIRQYAREPVPGLRLDARVEPGHGKER